MKIDDAIIDKVLNNKASAEDAKAVSEWLATEEGHDYLSKRIDREVSSLTENEVEDWVPHVIPEEKMQQRFLQQITLRRRVNSYRRWWAAAVLIPFIFLCGSVWFLADKVGLFSETEYAELVVPCGEQMRVVLQDGTIVQLTNRAGSLETCGFKQRFWSLLGLRPKVTHARKCGVLPSKKRMSGPSRTTPIPAKSISPSKKRNPAPLGTGSL